MVDYRFGRLPSEMSVLVAITVACTALGQSPNEYLHPNNRPIQNDDKYCGAYVVWHVLWQAGINVPINLLAERMQITSRGYSTVHDVVDTLRSYGVSARSAKLDIKDPSCLDAPFIPYLHPSGKSKMGHFVLCMPNDKDLVITDGPNAPRIRPKERMLAGRFGGRWDGTSILIAPDRGAFLLSGRPVDRFVYVARMLLGAGIEVDVPTTLACDDAFDGVTIDQEPAFTGIGI